MSPFTYFAVVKYMNAVEVMDVKRPCHVGNYVVDLPFDITHKSV